MPESLARVLRSPLGLVEKPAEHVVWMTPLGFPFAPDVVTKVGTVALEADPRRDALVPLLRCEPLGLLRPSVRLGFLPPASVSTMKKTESPVPP